MDREVNVDALRTISSGVMEADFGSGIVKSARESAERVETLRRKMRRGGREAAEEYARVMYADEMTR
jgi:hypothetical protein